MTPQTKALLLVGDLVGYIKEMDLNLSKKIALIMVDEIIDAIDWHEFEHPNKEFDYWYEVKAEIDNL